MQFLTRDIDAATFRRRFGTKEAVFQFIRHVILCASSSVRHYEINKKSGWTYHYDGGARSLTLITLRHVEMNIIKSKFNSKNGLIFVQAIDPMVYVNVCALLLNIMRCFSKAEANGKPIDTPPELPLVEPGGQLKLTLDNNPEAKMPPSCKVLDEAEIGMPTNWVEKHTGSWRGSILTNLAITQKDNKQFVKLYVLKIVLTEKLNPIEAALAQIKDFQ